MPFPFYVTITGDAGVEKVLVTSMTNNTVLNVMRGSAIGGTKLNFATERPTEYPSVSNPELWVCPPTKYMDGETCDCNCGMTDPDCLSGTLKVKFCASTEICSPLGRCTTPVYDVTQQEMAISEACHSMMLPGGVVAMGGGGPWGSWNGEKRFVWRGRGVV